MTAPTIDPARLDDLHLSYGGHASPKDGTCLMEAVAYLQGLPHTDTPRCVSPLLIRFGRRLNDDFHEPDRQKLYAVGAVHAVWGVARDAEWSVADAAEAAVAYAARAAEPAESRAVDITDSVVDLYGRMARVGRPS